MDLLITPAYAQSGGGSGGTSMIVSLLPFVGIFIVFYFIVIRPQQTKAKQLRESVKSLRRGDKIVTAGGIVAKVVRNQEDSNEMEIEIAPNVKVTVVRSTVTTVVDSKAGQANDNKSKSTAKIKSVPKKEDKADKDDKVVAEDKAEEETK